ncbi:Copine [Teladorsagia circumcincta]|uniref:Copine n=1 Tax=Teladorsagia circumcincta TaxID=45464 RepID=A0A2G9T5R1_TELCI|nr:Copine [Teladorsagia circumcincta]
MTASNGNPNQPDSLHFIHPHAQSPYVTAMLRLTPLFLGYMAHSRIGICSSGSHNDPHVDGVKGLLEAYRSAMMSVQPFAPTDFSEVIYHVSK